MQEINFLNNISLNNKKKDKGTKDKAVNITSANLLYLIIGVIVVTILTAGGFASLHFMTSRAATEEAELNIKISSLNSVVKIKDSIKNYEEKIKSMQSILASVSANTVINSEMFNKFSAGMPEEMYLLNYSISNIGDINFNGKTKNVESTAYFINKLNEVKIKQKNMFDDITIKSLNRTLKEDKRTEEYDFSIIAKLKK